MRIAGINKNDVVNGEGICVALFTQGCPFHCKGCFNSETWDYDGGKEVSISDLISEIETAIAANGVPRNFSILGGEPLIERNLEELKILLSTVKKDFPHITIFLWMGFTIEELTSAQKEVTQYVDVLIDGQYNEKLRDVSLHLRGSSNQRIFRANNEDS